MITVRQRKIIVWVRGDGKIDVEVFAMFGKPLCVVSERFTSWKGALRLVSAASGDWAGMSSSVHVRILEG